MDTMALKQTIKDALADDQLTTDEIIGIGIAAIDMGIEKAGTILQTAWRIIRPAILAMRKELYKEENNGS